MKENDVAYISEQFGIDKEIVEASVTDGTLSARLKDSLSKKKIYSEDEFSQLLKNHESEVQNLYFTDLVEKAKKGDIPQDIYKPVKGAAYQQLERELAKKYDVSEFTDLQDLISRINKPSANNVTDDVKLQLDELKQANLRLKEEKENAIKTVEQEYRQKFIDKEKLTALDKVPFDFTNAKPDELDNVRTKTKTVLKSVFDAEYKLDYDGQNRLVVTDTKGNIMKNDATREPVSVEDVLINLANEYNLKLVSPDKGGQGGKSSRSDSAMFANMEEFEQWCKSKNIATTSREALEMYRKAGLNKL